MGEVLFYRLAGTPPEAAMPELLEKCLERGWRVLLRVAGAAELALLDDRLWTYRDEAFLPHGRDDAPHAERQPILLTTGRANRNGASVLMTAFGARAEPAEMARFERACLFFDGEDEGALAAARDDWRAVCAAKIPATYWAQEDGRWVRKATS